MKVLAITNTYPTPETPGDTPAIKQQVLALESEGISVDVLHINYRHRSEYLKAALRVLALNFQPKRYDILHAYYGHCGAIARLQLRSPVVVTYRGSDLMTSKRWIGANIVNLVQGVIVMSEEMKAKSGREDAQVIPFGVNTDVFHPAPKDESRRDLGLPLDAKLVLFPYEPTRAQKRYDVFTATMDLLREDYPDIQEVIIYNETHERVARYMNACDVLLMTSDWEGSPVAVREAVACGLPVVSVDVGDVAQIIGNIEGSYISPQDPVELAAAVRRVFEDGTRSVADMAEVQVDALSAAKRVMDVYRDVLGDV